MSISPNVPNPQESYHYDNLGTPRWIAVLFALLFAALGLLAYAGHSVQSRLEQELTKSDDQNKILSAQLEQANARIADMKGQLDVTSQKIGMTQAEVRRPRAVPNPFARPSLLLTRSSLRKFPNRRKRPKPRSARSLQMSAVRRRTLKPLARISKPQSPSSIVRTATWAS